MKKIILIWLASLILLSALFISLDRSNNIDLVDSANKLAPAQLDVLSRVTFLDRINLFSCEKNDGVMVNGTMFYIGQGRFVTAQHVVSDTKACWEKTTLANLPIEMIDVRNDMAVFRFTNHEEWTQSGFEIDCNGYITGDDYDSYGYGSGEVFIQSRLTATNQFTDETHTIDGTPMPNLRLLQGFITFGMSGGPILNKNGEVVGLNNATAQSGEIGLSYELKNTYLCNQPLQ